MRYLKIQVNGDHRAELTVRREARPCKSCEEEGHAEATEYNPDRWDEVCDEEECEGHCGHEIGDDP